jgi:hypothetical protein
MALPSGARLGPYEVLSPLGAGGMGEVYRARDTRLGREVAIKVLPAELSSDSGRLRRFEKEARSASSLNHPNIVTVYDVGTADSTSYIAMELVEGVTLRQVLAEGALPIRRGLGLAAQVADGLAKAHEAGIVHRDLKPENVMVTKDGFAKILDFGLAKLTQPEDSSGGTQAPTVSGGTEPGMVVGTVAYMSPEQALGKPLDFRSDQFSFGSLLYEMATGRKAFARVSGPETMTAIIREEPEPLATMSPKTPAQLRWIVERCLSKEPRERYASTEDLARDLQNLREHLSEASASAEAVALEPGRRGLRVSPAILAAGLLAVLALGALGGRWVLRSAPSEPSYQRLTFRRGNIGEARFAPDGQTIVYNAAWDGNPGELFTTRLGASESRALGLGAASLRAVSSRGEMAFLLKPVGVGIAHGGTLARAPLAGGTPREVLESVQFADWDPDGKELVVVREAGTQKRLEYPPGKILYSVSVSAKLGWPRFSPEGKRIAFTEGPDGGSINGWVSVIDLAGRKKQLTSQHDGLWNVAWAPGAGEVWFSAPLRGGAGMGLYAVTLSGKERLLHSSFAGVRLIDMSRESRLLVTSTQARFGISGLGPGETGERDLSWLDWSYAMDISADGRTLLFDEEGEGGGPQGSVYVRKTDGSPPVRLGEGYGFSLSSDGRWALTIAPAGITLMPTGAGEAKLVQYPGIRDLRGARFFSDGRRLLLLAPAEKAGARLYVGDLDGGNLRPISPEGLRGNRCEISPDGELAAAIGPDGVPRLYAISGGEPRSIPGAGAKDIPLRFSADGRSLFLARLSDTFAEVHRVDLVSGRWEAWKELRASDPAGLSPSAAIQITPDGQHYAYSYRRHLDELILVEGLR